MDTIEFVMTMLLGGALALMAVVRLPMDTGTVIFNVVPYVAAVAGFVLTVHLYWQMLEGESAVEMGELRSPVSFDEKERD